MNIAARIEPLAIGGGICLSDTVYAQVCNKLDVGLTKLNSPELEHIEVPMDVCRVVLPWLQQAPVARKSTSPSPSKSNACLVVGGLGFSRRGTGVPPLLRIESERGTGELGLR